MSVFYIYTKKPAGIRIFSEYHIGIWGWDVYIERQLLKEFYRCIWVFIFEVCFCNKHLLIEAILVKILLGLYVIR